jgi:hypothetical protein
MPLEALAWCSNVSRLPCARVDAHVVSAGAHCSSEQAWLHFIDSARVLWRVGGYSLRTLFFPQEPRIRGISLAYLPSHVCHLPCNVRSAITDVVCMYLRRSISLFLFSYAQFARSTIPFFHCVDVGQFNGQSDVSVLFSTPAISCTSSGYEEWKPVFVVFLVIDVVLGPLCILGVLIWKRKSVLTHEELFSRRYGVLFEAFHGKVPRCSCVLLCSPCCADDGSALLCSALCSVQFRRFGTK